jgi:hypothetical protein
MGLVFRLRGWLGGMGWVWDWKGDFVSFFGKRFQPMSRDNVYISLLMG